MKKEDVLKKIEELDYESFVFFLTILKNLKVFNAIRTGVFKYAEIITDEYDFYLKPEEFDEVIFYANKFHGGRDEVSVFTSIKELYQLIDIATFIVKNKINKNELNIVKLLAVKYQEHIEKQQKEHVEAPF